MSYERGGLTGSRKEIVGRKFKVHYLCSMFNKFRQHKKKEDGRYVYGLTDNGRIFYVGVADSVRQRYSNHFSEMYCSRYIYWMKERGHYPGVVIFGIFYGYDQAEAAEHSIIRCLSFMGNKLCNYHLNPPNNAVMNCIPEEPRKTKKMPRGLADKIVNEAINNYKQFTQWQPATMYGIKEFH